MAKLVFGMNQSLDGYVDHTAFAPGPKLFRHFIDQTKAQAGSLYGRKLYEIMAYWDEDQDGWGPAEHDFAHKWVVSRTLKSVGPNATLLGPDLEKEIRKLKSDVGGVIDVGGPSLAKTLTERGLIDEYRIYLHPVVIGQGTPFFAAARPPLRLTNTERFDDSTITLTYVPA
jgi:dihydrofolate reductase